jgi:glutamate synthase (NADPH/NADH) small chain
VFVAGDARIGQSLVVNAIAEGRRCARVVDRHLAAVSVA